MLLLYIDPGTGSMLFTILIGILSAGIYLSHVAISKLGIFFAGGAAAKHKQQGRMPVAIFTDSKRYWSLFEPICDEFERRGEKLHYLTASPDDPALEKEYKHVTCTFIGEGNKAFVVMNNLNADIVLSTTPGLDVYQWKRSRNVSYYVHVLHAPSDVVIYRMFGLDYYDSVLISGEYMKNHIRELESKRSLPEKEIVMGGQPMLDMLQKKLDSAGDVPEHPTTILLAPSWGKSSILNKYGERFIDALKETGYKIIIRPHPQSFTSEKQLMDTLMAKYPDDEQIEWNRDNDNFEVIRRSDLLISDFSGVIFEYTLVFRKPVICADTSFDKAPYDACWLDEETWTFSTLPKISKPLTEDSIGNIKELIDSVLGDKSYLDAIDAARDETWNPRGIPAETITDYLIDKRHQLLEEEKKKEEEKAAAPVRKKKLWKLKKQEG